MKTFLRLRQVSTIDGSFVIHRLAIAIAFLLGTTSVAANATAEIVLGNPGVNGTISGIGERPPGVGVAEDYFAQSFTTPADATSVRRIGFYIQNSTDSPSFGVNTNGPLIMRVLLTSLAIDAGGRRPDQVLFESAPVTIPYTDDVAPLSLVEVTLPDVGILPSTEYAFVLDAATDLTLQDDVAPRGQVQKGEGYNGGRFFSYRVPWEQTGGIVGPRSAHFAADWAEFTPEQNVDMAFQITFVPEPPSLIFAACGACLALVLRRRLLAYKLTKSQ